MCMHTRLVISICGSQQSPKRAAWHARIPPQAAQQRGPWLHAYLRHGVVVSTIGEGCLALHTYTCHAYPPRAV
jgi:hypothetical protein